MVKYTQTIRRQFEHFVGLALKGLISVDFSYLYEKEQSFVSSD